MSYPNHTFKTERAASRHNSQPLISNSTAIEPHVKPTWLYDLRALGIAALLFIIITSM